MLFNSLGFAIFLPIVFFIYWFVAKGNLKLQNALLLIASYYFYACWDWRFLFLLVFSTLLDFATGIKMYESKTISWKRLWFWLSIGVNLGFLGFFKYYNFFASSFAEGLSDIGIRANFWTLQVILPVGISFYTFHGLSYVIDIYKGRIKPERNFIDYSVFVSFFPLLVAGPIESQFQKNYLAIKKLEFDLKKNLEIPVLNKPEDFEFNDSLFFDTIYHLNKEGREKRTKESIKIFSKNKDFQNNLKSALSLTQQYKVKENFKYCTN